MKYYPGMKMAWLLPVFMMGASSLASADENAKPVAPASGTRTITFTSGAQIGKMKLLNTNGGTGERTCDLLSADGQSGPTLPDGLNFGTDCTLDGTLAAAGEKTNKFTYQVRVRDQGGGIAQAPIVVLVNPPLIAAVDAVRLTSGGTITVPIYPFRINGGTGNTLITYLNAQNEPVKAPSGMEFSPDGSISGKVPASGANLSGMKAVISDQGGGRVVQDMVWNINPPITMDVSNVQVTAGGRLDAPAQIVKVAGGSGSIHETLFESDGKAPAVLPEGMQFNEVNGTLEGVIPGTMSEKKYMIRAIDQGGGAIERPFILKVNPPLTLSLM